MKLISCTDYVTNYFKTGDLLPQMQKLNNYANFLKQPLTLSMFVPCDDEGNVLKVPKYWNKKYNDDIPESELILCEEYRQAKERIIFDCVKIDNSNYKDTKRLLIDLDCQGGFRLYNKHIYHDGTIEEKFLPNFSKTPTIEYLIQFNLTITPTAVKTYQL